MSLTDMQCRNAKPHFRLYQLSDGDGLCLQVNPSGTKYWRYKFRLHGKQRILAIGVYPVVSLLDARERRDKAKKEIEQGQDPVLNQASRKQLAKFSSDQSFEKVALEWHERNKYKWSDKHAACIIYRFEQYLFPTLARFPVNSITPQQLLSCLQKVENTSAHIARRLLQYCGGVFKYAVLTGRMQHDFSDTLKEVMRRPTKNHYNCIDLEELPQLLKAIHSDKERSYKQVNLAMQFMLHTFVRTKELLGAKWSEFDFDNALWVIPADRMKRKLQHLVPLSKQSLRILEELKEMNGHRQFVFPSIPYPRKPMSNMTLLTALARMGYKHRMTGHGFRSLGTGVATEKLNYPYDIVDRQLSHVPQSEIRRAYDRAKHLPQRRQMMQDISDYYEKISNQQSNERTVNDQSNTYGTFTHHNRNITPQIKFKPLNIGQTYQGGQVS